MITFFNVIAILELIELFGILPKTSSIFLRGDFFILSSFVLMLLGLRRANIGIKEYFFHGIAKYVTYIWIYFLVVAAFTYLRGGVDIKSLLLMIRIYFPLLLFYPLNYDIIFRRKYKFYLQFIFICGFIVTFLLLFLSIFPIDVSAIFPRIAYGFQVGQYDIGLRRVYMFESFVFPIFAFLLSLFLYYEKKRVDYIILIFIFLIGSLLQGFRSYIIGSGGAVILSLFLKGEKKSMKKVFQFTGYVIIGLTIISFASGSWGILGRIASGFSDFRNTEGTFSARVIQDAFRFQIFFSNPAFGIGFVHSDSEKAKELGASSSDDLKNQTANDPDSYTYGMYSLRSTDSGYLDLLVQFGIIGAAILLLIFYRLFRFQLIEMRKRKANSACVLASITMLIVLIVTQISHAGLTNSYGLTPLALVLALSSYNIYINEKNTSFHT